MEKEIFQDNLPTVAIIGRANAGKSTLFNRLTEKSKALVSNQPGTTRTSNEETVLWRGKIFKLVDTGGVRTEKSALFEEEVQAQNEKITRAADVIIFLIDGKSGVMPVDREMASRLRRIKNKKIFLAINKIDRDDDEYLIPKPEWYRLGLGTPNFISSLNGRGIGDFLDLIWKNLSSGKKRPKNEKSGRKIIDVCLFGKPNVGKSSLFNKLIGVDKVIVSPIPHTTREPADTLVEFSEDDDPQNKHLINFVDTAGIRKKARVEPGLERAGIMKSLESLKKSDIVLFVLDGSEPFSSQDAQLGSMVEYRGKGLIILINKWDLAEDNSDHKRNESIKAVRAYFPHLKFAPIMFVSGLTGYGTEKIFHQILKVDQNRATVVDEKILQTFLEETVHVHRPSRGKGVRHPKLVAFKQIGSSPPVFELFIKAKTSLHLSYVHFLENKLRENFAFGGTPIIIKLTKMKK